MCCRVARRVVYKEQMCVTDRRLHLLLILLVLILFFSPVAIQIRCIIVVPYVTILKK